MIRPRNSHLSVGPHSLFHFFWNNWFLFLNNINNDEWKSILSFFKYSFGALDVWNTGQSFLHKFDGIGWVNNLSIHPFFHTNFHTWIKNVEYTIIGIVSSSQFQNQFYFLENLSRRGWVKHEPCLTCLTNRTNFSFFHFSFFYSHFLAGTHICW